MELLALSLNKKPIGRIMSDGWRHVRIPTEEELIREGVVSQKHEMISQSVYKSRPIILLIKKSGAVYYEMHQLRRRDRAHRQ